MKVLLHARGPVHALGGVLLDRAIAEGPHWTEAERAAHLAAHDWSSSAAALLAVIEEE